MLNAPKKSWESASEFKFKTYRCEWQVQSGSVDQYGQNFTSYKIESFATYVEANLYRPTIAKLNPHNKLWIPNDAPHGYCETRINYIEVEVKDGSPTE